MGHKCLHYSKATTLEVANLESYLQVFRSIDYLMKTKQLEAQRLSHKPCNNQKLPRETFFKDQSSNVAPITCTRSFHMEIYLDNRKHQLSQFEF